MDSKMFCFQCEQTAGGTGCQGCAGVCGKSYEVAGLQDELTGALIGLAKTSEKNGSHEAGTYRLLIKGLFTTITNVNFNEATIQALIDEVHAEKQSLVPNCSACASPCRPARGGRWPAGRGSSPKTRCGCSSGPAPTWNRKAT